MPYMTLEQQLLDRFGPLLTLNQLAELLHRSPKGLTLTLSKKGQFASQINSTKIRFGRRLYFRAGEIATLLEGRNPDTDL